MWAQGLAQAKHSYHHGFYPLHGNKVQFPWPGLSVAGTYFPHGSYTWKGINEGNELA